MHTHRDDPASRLYDWNEKDRRGPILRKPPALLDETLRDGLQSPSARDPSLDEKIELVALMSRLGIDAVDLGLPGAGPRACRDVERLARFIVGPIAPRAPCSPTSCRSSR
jgi:2-isopropylmalate synthase